MTKQEQIDGLKRIVAKQGVEIAHLQRVAGLSAMAMNEPPPVPICGQCGMAMYEGLQCQNADYACPMGVGVKSPE